MIVFASIKTTVVDSRPVLETQLISETRFILEVSRYMKGRDQTQYRLVSPVYLDSLHPWRRWYPCSTYIVVHIVSTVHDIVQLIKYFEGWVSLCSKCAGCSICWASDCNTSASVQRILCQFWYNAKIPAVVVIPVIHTVGSGLMSCVYFCILTYFMYCTLCANLIIIITVIIIMTI